MPSRRTILGCYNSILDIAAVTLTYGDATVNFSGAIGGMLLRRATPNVTRHVANGIRGEDVGDV